MLCRSSSDAALQFPQSCCSPGEEIHGAPPVPLAGAGAAPYMDLESVSLLLMSTSKSLSFAFMCLYSLYSSAIGVRSSFWTFLMGTKGKGAEARLLSPRGYCSEVNEQHAERCTVSTCRISVAKRHWGSQWALGLDKQWTASASSTMRLSSYSYSGILWNDMKG